MKKRAVSILLTVFLLLSISPVTCFASVTELTMTLSCAAEEIHAKDQVSITLDVSDNPGIAGVALDVLYDANVLTFTDATTGTVSGGSVTTVNAAANYVGWEISGTTDCTGTGTLMTLTFTVNDGVTDGTNTQVSVQASEEDEYNITNSSIEPVPYTVTPCTITIGSSGGGETTTVDVTGVSLNKDTLTLTEGADETLTATVTPEDATDKSVTWSSSDETVATVADGVVTAVKAGSATITVTTTDGSKTDTCTVTVNCAHSGAQKTAEKTATCKEAGHAAYWFCDDCDTYFADNNGVRGAETTLEALTTAIDSTAHNFSNVWSHDETQHWRACQNTDANAVACEVKGDVANHTWAVKSGSGTATGHTVVCTVCGYEKNSEVAHDDSTTAADDPSNTTYQQITGNDTQHNKVLGCGGIIVENHSWDSAQEVVTDPTCTTNKITKHVCANCGYVWNEETPNTATGHNYPAQPSWQWADDGKSATATLTCTECGVGTTGHTLTDTVTYGSGITGATKTSATCSTKGTTTYTATVTLNGTQYTDTKDVQDIACVAHTYGAVQWQWANDGKSATATLTCTECSEGTTGHTLSDTVTYGSGITSATKTAATCTAKGTTTYTATVTLNNTQYNDEKDVEDLTALGHSWSQDWTTDGTNHWHVCTRTGCNEVDGTAAHTLQYQTSLDGTKHYQECTVCGYKTEEVAHSYNYVSDNAAGHHQHCSVCGHDTATVAHTFSTNDCSVASTCTACGYERAAGQHTGTIVYTWLPNENAPTSCKAELTCSSCGTHIEQTVSVTSQVNQPTCESKGSTVYTATFTTTGLAGAKTKTVEINAKGHDFSEAPSWSWTGYTSATATFTCKNDSSHKHQETATGSAITSEVTTAPGCETTGVRTYTATVTYGGHTYTDSKTEVISATGHSYGTPSYEWNDATHQCTATRTCTATGCDNQETETATGVQSTVTAPTCAAKGQDKYTATFTNSAFSQQVKYIETDKNPANHSNLQHFAAKAPTCTVDGNVEYWYCSGCQKYYSNSTASTEITQAQTVDAKTGHNYGAAEWSWENDGKSATVTRTCTNDSSHKLTATVTFGNGITDEITTPATCTEKGTTTYTATAALDGTPYSDTKDVQDVTALGHDFTEKIADQVHLKSAATCQTPAIYYYGCSRCNVISTTETFSSGTTSAHNYVNGVCTVCGAANPIASTVTESAVDDLVRAAASGGEGIVVATVAGKTQEEVVAMIKEAAANGTLTTKNEVSEITEANVPAEDKQAIGTEISKIESGTLTLGNTTIDVENVEVKQYLDLSIALVASGTDLGSITTTDTPVEFNIPLDSNLVAELDGKVVFVLRIHGDEVDVLPATLTNGILTFTTDKFSTYAIVAADPVEEEPTPTPYHGGGSGNSSSGKTIVTDLTGIYAVYVDGVKLDSKYYTINGGTVTLTAEFLKTLSNGKHTFKAENATHISTATFNVQNGSAVNSAQTGDAGIAIYAAMSVMSLLGMGWVGKKRHN